MQPLTGPYFGLSRKDILELPLQEELFHTHLLDCLDFENYVIIASFGFDVGHDGKVSLSSAEGLQDELEVDGREPKRRWRPGTVSIFKQLATMTAVEFASQPPERILCNAIVQTSHRLGWCSAILVAGLRDGERTKVTLSQAGKGAYAIYVFIFLIPGVKV